MTSKTPTPQGISALLNRAGFDRAEVKMRGGRSGFKVRASTRQAGAVEVEWRPFLLTSETTATRSDHLAKYAEAITAAGWTVEASEYELTVTAGKDETR